MNLWYSIFQIAITTKEGVMGLVQLASPVMIFADIWNLTSSQQLFGSERVRNDAASIDPDILSFPFARMVEEIQGVVGSDNLLAFNAFYRLPNLPQDASMLEAQYRVEDSIMTHLRKEIPTQVNFFTKPSRDIDSLIVGTVWHKAMEHMRREIIQGRKLPIPLDVALVSGDGVFAKSLEQFQDGFRSLIDIRVHIFSWKEKTSQKFNHALAFGKVHSVNVLSSHFRQKIAETLSKKALEGASL